MISRVGRPVCVTCPCVLASDTASAGGDQCSSCRGNDRLPLTVEELAELADLGFLWERPAAVLGLDRELYFECGHPRTPENTLVEVRSDRFNPDGTPQTRERCRTCKRGTNGKTP